MLRKPAHLILYLSMLQASVFIISRSLRLFACLSDTTSFTSVYFIHVQVSPSKHQTLAQR